jgi:hypothetical protein
VAALNCAEGEPGVGDGEGVGVAVGDGVGVGGVSFSIIVK